MIVSCSSGSCNTECYFRLNERASAWPSAIEGNALLGEGFINEPMFLLPRFYELVVKLSRSVQERNNMAFRHKNDFVIFLRTH
jgi:hypothetical protein